MLLVKAFSAPFAFVRASLELSLMNLLFLIRGVDVCTFDRMETYHSHKFECLLTMKGISAYRSSRWKGMLELTSPQHALIKEMTLYATLERR